MKEELLLPIIAWAAALPLLAQASLPDPGVMALVGNGVTVAVLAWYVIYDVRTRTPQMVKTFTDEQAQSRDVFGKAIENMRQTFIAEQNACRQAFREEQSATRTQFNAELNRMQDMLFANMNAMRKAVHDVKDTAQVFITKKAETEKVETEIEAGRQ